MTQLNLMPPAAPLSRPIQNLRAPHSGGSAPSGRRSKSMGWRVATFLPAIVTTVALIAAFTDWFAMDGLTGFEGVLIALIAVTFFWISLSVSTVTVGILNLLRRREDVMPKAVRPMNVALLVPAYNEVPWDVFGNACAMLEALNGLDQPHSYGLFILSDTRDDAIAEQELRAFATLRAKLPADVSIYYRRRPDNTDRKVGNLADWVEQWGGGYEAMLVLDADSLMSGEAIVALTDELSADPSAGLIQSFPQLFGAQTLFGRVQQFASTIYGAALAEGLAKWSDREGNYWGHNAIIRTAAFAASAGLPRLDTFRRKGALILSHDFVEAGLLRRAGWAVRFMPRIKGSYEEVPATLVDYALRDRRWCQGNLQHLNILGSKGFHAVTRFHLFAGAMGYLLSPAWFILLTVWALVGKQESNVITYFSGLNPQVVWPELSAGVAYVNNLLILIFMYGMLLAPKFMGATAVRFAGLRMQDLGGLGQFVLSFVTELFVSILYAPILMVQQTIAVIRTFAGVTENWVPHQRAGGSYSLWTLAKFHVLETAVGLLLVAGMIAGLVTWWLSPIALSLALAIPLSALSGWNLTRSAWSRLQLGTPEVFNAPAIIRSAMAERLALRKLLEDTDRVAAE